MYRSSVFHQTIAQNLVDFGSGERERSDFGSDGRKKDGGFSSNLKCFWRFFFGVDVVFAI
ncbi:hypothetical protein Hanom_Chr03g00193041 [Helianthus anomalus]